MQNYRLTNAHATLLMTSPALDAADILKHERKTKMNELAVSNQMNLSDLGTILAKSGFFSDTKDAAQAIVKVLAGQELGFGPIASMTGIFVIQNRISMSANLIAAAIKRTRRYNYRVIELTDERCEIA